MTRLCHAFLCDVYPWARRVQLQSGLVLFSAICERGEVFASAALPSSVFPPLKTDTSGEMAPALTIAIGALGWSSLKLEDREQRGPNVRIVGSKRPSRLAMGLILAILVASLVNAFEACCIPCSVPSLRETPEA